MYKMGFLWTAELEEVREGKGHGWTPGLTRGFLGEG